GGSNKQADNEIVLQTDHYASSSIVLHNGPPSAIRCFVMMPLAPANGFLRRLNRIIFVSGAAAVALAALLFGFVARTITKPLDNLVAGGGGGAAGGFLYFLQTRRSNAGGGLGSALSCTARGVAA